LRDDRFGLAAGFADARRIVARKGALLALGMPTNAGGNAKTAIGESRLDPDGAF
jgi:hypothetical protein